jgi:hypothetical protein
LEAPVSEFSLVYTLATPGGTVAFNSGTDQLYLQGVTGFDGAPIRAPIDNRAQAHGGLVHRFLLGPRHLTFDGIIHCPSAGTEAAYLAARNTLITNLQNALNSIYGADGILTWTPSGGSLQHLAVRHDQPLQITGGWMKQFVFGLVAANPNPY